MSKHMYLGSNNIIKKISAAFVHDLLTMSNENGYHLSAHAFSDGENIRD